MPTILLLVLCSVLIFLMALVLARELRLRRSYERLLSKILTWRRSRDATACREGRPEERAQGLAGAVPNPFRVISPQPPLPRAAAQSPLSRHQVCSW